MPQFAHRDIKRAIRDRYAWPGGYPLYIVLSDGASLCVDCGRSEWRHLVRAALKGDRRGGWYPECAAINWEDADMCCAHCGNMIECAYPDSADSED